MDSPEAKYNWPRKIHPGWRSQRDDASSREGTVVLLVGVATLLFAPAPTLVLAHLKH